MNRYGREAFWKRLVNSFGNGLLWEKLRRRVWRSRLVSAFRRRRAERLPVDPNKVLFVTSSWSCTCNPKYIARELARRRPDVDVVWLLSDAAWRACGGKPGTGRAVRRWTGAAYRELATAKVVVENSHFFVSRGNPAKRPGQFVMNTWHGSLGIKRLDAGKSATDGMGLANAAVVDALLSNSDFDDAVFASSPLAAAPRFRTGHPRNDVFFLPPAEQAEIRRRVFAALGVPEGARLAVFAPTFRDDALAEGSCAYAFREWKDALERRFGGSWTIAMRLHPLDAKALAEGLLSFPEGVLDATGYEDMQELLVAADAGITDYSSWIYDYLLGGRPGFLFAPDKAAYDAAHGFYYPLESTPFPVAETNEALCGAIESFDAERYAAASATFISDKGCMEDGQASARAVDIVEGWMNEVWK
ncbi:MAG: CDP-glycerol glycerophosphotransferase family protein [Kiritimatiellae bacterium]|nr:CDP-glycerol glycerophosphotransferase family protein [Kiritimatiellia bacterium]